MSFFPLLSLDNYYYVLYLYPDSRTHRYAWYAPLERTRVLEKERKRDSKKKNMCGRIGE